MTMGDSVDSRIGTKAETYMRKRRRKDSQQEIQTIKNNRKK